MADLVPVNESGERMLRGANIHIKKLIFNIQYSRFHGTSSRQCPHLDHMVQTSKAYIKDDNMTTEEGLSYKK
jgi:CRISPR/Cas system-associated endoribonuclease Cas2